MRQINQYDIVSFYVNISFLNENSVNCVHCEICCILMWYE